MECHELEAGTYLLFCEVDWVANTQDKSCNITSYGPTKINFEDVTDFHTKEKFIKDILIRIAETDDGENEKIETELVESNEAIKRVSVSTGFGYSGYIIINGAEDCCYKEDAEFK